MSEPVSRRFFLGGMLAVSAASVLPLSSALATTPILYGDGVHDDTAALQALFDGEKVVCHSDGIVVQAKGWFIRLDGGTYLVSKTLDITQDQTTVVNATFKAKGVVGPVLHLKAGDYCFIDKITVWGDYDNALRYTPFDGVFGPEGVVNAAALFS